MRKLLLILIASAVMLCAVSCFEEPAVEPKPFCNLIVSNNSGKTIYCKTYKATDEAPESWTCLPGNIYPEPGTEYRIDYCYVVKTKTEIRDNELSDVTIVSTPESMTFMPIDGVMKLRFTSTDTGLAYILIEED